MNLSTQSLSAVTAAPSIVEDIDWLCGSNSSSYPLAQKLRNINLYYHDVGTAIIGAQSNWEWDDTNKTDFPIGTTTLVASQKDYALPTDFLKILRVEVKDSGGSYQKVQQFDETQVSVGLFEFNKTDGLPVFYREIGNSIELYPAAAASSVTLTAGLKIYYQRTVTELTTADAAVSPGFAKPFHRILSLGAAYDYAMLNLKPDITARLKLALDTKMEELRMTTYSNTNKSTDSFSNVSKNSSSISNVSKHSGSFSNTTKNTDTIVNSGNSSVNEFFLLIDNTFQFLIDDNYKLWIDDYTLDSWSNVNKS